jgi:DAK2 domain fusion protein YloV
VRLDASKSTYDFSEKKFRDQIGAFGDSLLVVADDDLVKVHIHSEQPGKVLDYALQYGELLRIKIENMREQHTSILEKDLTPAEQIPATQPEKAPNAATESTRSEEQELKPYGLITVAMGDGIADIFQSLGVDHVIQGGQTMNPSTEEIVKAIKGIRAQKVFILPNNSNIIMAAEQSKHLTDIPVIVIPTKTIPQGLAAILAFNPIRDDEQNAEAMRLAISDVKSGQVTYAVRDSQFDEIEIKEGDYLGISEGKIVIADRDLMKTALHLLKSMIADGEELVTVLYGENVTEQHTRQLVNEISSVFPDVEMDVQYGGQPVYYFIFSVES